MTSDLTPVREFTSVEEMRADAKARRARLLAVKPVARTAAPTIRAVAPSTWDESQARLKRQEQDRLAAEAEALFLASKDSLAATMRGVLKAPPVKALIREFADTHGLTVEDLTGPRRDHPLVFLRQDAMAFVKERRSITSLGEIGRYFGDRHHTTVLYALRQVEKRRAAASGSA